MNWEASQWVCMHIRRTDLKIYQVHEYSRFKTQQPVGCDGQPAFHSA